MREHRVFAAFYDMIFRPFERRLLGGYRADLVADLTGVVLDVGAGTGANLPHYRAARRVVAAEPDAAMRAKLAGRLAGARVPVEVTDAGAESLPYADATFDAVVFTLVLCTVPDPDRALAEARRVLRPGGRLVVLEHVRGTGRLAAWQDRLAPLWSRVAAGCRPNRHTRANIERAGFTFDRVEESAPLPRWVLIRTLLRGVAVRGG
jgi:ubiquinone/menaquinone biosynthesis C-methylase UbiE